VFNYCTPQRPSGQDVPVTQWLSSEEQRAWRAYLEATAVLFDKLDQQMQRDSGMPHGYYEILVRLSEAPQRSLRMSQLAENTQSSRSRLSHAVAALEGKGWVQRRPTPDDRRGQLAVLTDLGFSTLEQAAPGHVEAVRASLYDRLSPTQVAQLRTIFETVLGECPPDEG
jgi:DNA-binding MarR family transcriptional regulator